MADKILTIGDKSAIPVTEEQLQKSGLAIDAGIEVLAINGALIVVPQGSERAEFLKGALLSMQKSPTDYEKLAK